MLRLYITRHGETEWNLEKRMQGWKDSSLTQKGTEDAIKLGESMKNIDFSCIYSSSSPRTLRTSELIRGDRDINIIPVDDLREMNLGDWEGKTADEAARMDKEGQKSFWETPHLYVPKSGESYFEVRERATKAINKIIQSHETGNVLIVTHAIIVKTIMSHFKSLPVERLWENPFIHGTSLSIVEVLGDRATAVVEGDISHLNK